MRTASPFVAAVLAAVVATTAPAQEAKKLSDPTVPTATTVGTDDLFYILQSGTGKKISGVNLNAGIFALGMPNDALAHYAQIDTSTAPNDQDCLAWDDDTEIFVWQNCVSGVPDGDYGVISITGGFWSLDSGVVEADNLETFGDTPNSGDCLSWGGLGNMLWEPRTKDNVYTLTVGAANTLGMTDAQTLYFGHAFGEGPSTTANERRVYIPVDGTITGIQLYAFASTAGSDEGWTIYIRKNDSSDTAIAVVSASSQHRTWATNGLSISVVAGDYIEIKSINPTWATNPAGVRFSGTLVVTR